MTTVTLCDLCDNKLRVTQQVTRVTFLDGEHPHNGSTMKKSVDVCDDCLAKIQEKVKSTHICQEEFDDVRALIKKGGSL